MKAPEQLRKPENWQDFEKLCWKLWGEIWKCPEIKKNGRKGQPQCGVDIYGFLKDTPTEYYGIQCKGKDESLGKKLTKKEIDKEIEKARNFIPKLKKLYFATTANKNVAIEEYMRIKNNEQIEIGSFEVYLFSWEDIVDLIDENKNTHDWYVKSQNFRLDRSCELTFHDGSKEITIHVPFKQKIINYQLESSLLATSPFFKATSLLGYGESQNKSMDSWRKQQDTLDKIYPAGHNSRSINKSICRFSIQLNNTGELSIEDFKINFEFDGDCEKVGLFCDIKDDHVTFPLINPIATRNRLANQEVWINAEDGTGLINPIDKKIVGDEIRRFSAIGIIPKTDPQTIKLRWKLVSDNFKDEGVLILNIVPEIKRDIKTVFVNDASKERREEGEIQSIFEIETRGN